MIGVDQRLGAETRKCVRMGSGAAVGVLQPRAPRCLGAEEEGEHESAGQP